VELSGCYSTDESVMRMKTFYSIQINLQQMLTGANMYTELYGHVKCHFKTTKICRSKKLM